MKNLLYLLCLLCLAAGSGCSGSIQVEKTRAHRKEATAIKKVVYIEPGFDHLFLTEKKPKDYEKESLREQKLTALLKENASQCKMEAVVVDANTLQAGDVDYFNTLAPLRRKIYLANFTQDIKSSRQSYTRLNEVQSKVLKRAPIISSEYSFLSKKYGTPYFGVQGIKTVSTPFQKTQLITALLFPPIGIPLLFRSNSHTYYYHIVVNVETAEVVYREIRYVRARANDDNLSVIMYDSFKILTKK